MLSTHLATRPRRADCRAHVDIDDRTLNISAGPTALFKIVVTPHFGYMGGHAKYKSGVHSYSKIHNYWRVLKHVFQRPLNGVHS